MLLCGHTHVPRVVRLADGRLVVNPGSVGLQMNYGSPDAHYALIERRGGDWSVSLRTVPYDRSTAAALAARNGFPAWGEALIGGSNVKLSSFGSFQVRSKNERIGRNPKTGEEVPILPRQVLVFKPSNVLKSKINKSMVRAGK